MKKNGHQHQQNNYQTMSDDDLSAHMLLDDDSDDDNEDDRDGFHVSLDHDSTVTDTDTNRVGRTTTRSNYLASEDLWLQRPHQTDNRDALRYSRPPRIRTNRSSGARKATTTTTNDSDGSASTALPGKLYAGQGAVTDSLPTPTRVRFSSYDGVTRKRPHTTSHSSDMGTIERLFTMRYRGSSLHRQEDVQEFFNGQDGPTRHRGRAQSDGDALLMSRSHIRTSLSEESGSAQHTPAAVAAASQDESPSSAPKIRPSYMQTLLLKQKLRQKLVFENVDEQQQLESLHEENQGIFGVDIQTSSFVDSAPIVDDSDMSTSQKETHSNDQQDIHSLQAPSLSSIRSTMVSSGPVSPFVTLPSVLSAVTDHDSHGERRVPSRAEIKEDLRELVVEVQKEPELQELSAKLREIHALIAPYIPEQDRQKLAAVAMMHLRRSSTTSPMTSPTASAAAAAAAASSFGGNSPFPLEVRLEKVSYRTRTPAKAFSQARKKETNVNRMDSDGETSVEEQASSSTRTSCWAYIQTWFDAILPRRRDGTSEGKKAENSRQPSPSKHILHNVNLVIEPGQQYLVVGPPSSGKSTLLKAISGILDTSDSLEMDGSITYNGKTLHECNHPDKSKGHDRSFFIENAFAYIDQLDQHAALLTVRETLSFAWHCKTGGRVQTGNENGNEVGKGLRLNTELPCGHGDDSSSYFDEVAALASKAAEDELPLKVVLTILGLMDAEDTFVGDPVRGIQGVSGGQRRRVTVGEMITGRVPVLLGDEISNGLDSSSTYDLVESLLHFGRLQNYSRVISLLQPSPEVVALFDQVIVLSQGRIIYAGPVDEVEDYFASLGFRSPDFLDISDFLQLVSTEDRESLYDADVNGAPCPTLEQLALHFSHESPQGQDIRLALSNPHDLQLDPHGSVVTDPGEGAGEKVIHTFDAIKRKYALGFWGQVWLLAKRFLLLWIRDKKALRFSVIRNIVNGASVGGAFFNASETQSIQGALFQTGIFVLLGSLQTISGLVQERTIYDKQSHANFYSPGAYVLAKTFSLIPQTFVLDTCVSGATLYFMVSRRAGVLDIPVPYLFHRVNANFFFVASVHVPGRPWR
jgi:ABC-type multidrug transport system ATPase subunit